MMITAETIRIHLRWLLDGTVTVRLWHHDGEVLGRAGGHGYDVVGSAMGEAVSRLWPKEFSELAKASTEETRKNDHYGLLVFADGTWAINGSCGTVPALVRAIGWDWLQYETAPDRRLVLLSKQIRTVQQ